jgi:hypothetical protein
MVLTKAELIASLQKEARIFVHLCGKVDRTQLDYRPTAKQRSTIEWVRYISVMGPTLVKAALAGEFDPAAWTENAKQAESLSFDEVVAAIAAQPDQFAALLAGAPDSEFRKEVTFFGTTQSCGSFLVNVVLMGYAAYRTQLFNYLKACGREELTTMNLWAGMDAPAA